MVLTSWPRACPHCLHLVSRRAVPGGAEVCGSLWSQKSALSCTLTVENKSVLVLQAPQRFQTLKGHLELLVTFSALSWTKWNPAKLPWWTQHFVPNRSLWKACWFCMLFPQRCQALAWKLRNYALTFLRVLSYFTSSVKAREDEGNLISSQDPGSLLTFSSSTQLL